jgi:hypothetical protein
VGDGELIFRNINGRTTPIKIVGGKAVIAGGPMKGQALKGKGGGANAGKASKAAPAAKKVAKGPDFSETSEGDFENDLRDAIETSNSFEERGLLTSNRGLVIKLPTEGKPSEDDDMYDEKMERWEKERMNEAEDLVSDAVSEAFPDARIRTFEDVGMLTRDRGLVVRDGKDNEFQLTLTEGREEDEIDVTVVKG